MEHACVRVPAVLAQTASITVQFVRLGIASFLSVYTGPLFF
jgi:hypothetical protein